ncbi:fimbrial biogenesis chaperone [Moellerella wisconsensis]|uniref:Pili assembly chaperone n=1 Tax=Moellerella wisconsensis ATCC 35017 TaxID=1354267 RepID=A0A0N0I9D8_9GAMM|nr:molecular chaperone [Moellerella wisconsensis]KPD02092.1 pili assembly chaperone [Moellerella wisconsensis ATCC 35017]
MINKHNFIYWLFIILGIMIISPAYSGIIASNNRVIFNEGDFKKNLILGNTNEYSIFAQTWIDNGEGSGEFKQKAYPFVSVPAVFVLNQGEMTNLNIIYNNKELPSDRESVFWLNLYEIPAVKNSSNKEQTKVLVAMNTQMKIFYRPKSLKEINKNMDDIYFSLSNSGNETKLICHNPTPFYISFSGITLKIKNISVNVLPESDMMTSPLSSREYKLPHQISDLDNINVEANIIDDHGQSQPFVYKIKKN